MDKLDEFIWSQYMRTKPSDIMDAMRERQNRKIRNMILERLDVPKTSREKEIEDAAIAEKNKYEEDKAIFEANPLHWTNNKRRRYGLCPLRGQANKCRRLKFRNFMPSVRLFMLIEDIVDETISENMNDNFFNKFVEVKSLV